MPLIRVYHPPRDLSETSPEIKSRSRPIRNQTTKVYYHVLLTCMVQRYVRARPYREATRAHRDIIDQHHDNHLRFTNKITPIISPKIVHPNEKMTTENGWK